MNYRQRSKKQKRVLILGTFGIVALLLLTLFHVPLPTSLQDTLRTAATPFLRASNSLSGLTYSATALLVPKEDLLREQALLRDQIEDFAYVANENTFLKEENAQLRDLLGYAQTTQYIPRPVIAGPPESPYDTLILGTKGVAIKENTLVFAHEGPTAIGTVSRILGKTADVMLFSHPDSVLAVRIGSERIPAQAKGVSGGVLTARIPDASPIAEGDTVTLAGTEMTYTIGLVERIEDHTHDAEATAYIRMPVNIFTLTHVFISDTTRPPKSLPVHNDVSTTTETEN